MIKGHFDATGFYAALDSQRQSRRLNWKQVAREAGISASTLTRIAQGKRPDVDSSEQLLAWSGVESRSICHEGTRVRNAPRSAGASYRVFMRRPASKPEAAAALEAVLKAAYEKLRQD